MFVGTILFLAIGSLAIESYTYQTEGYIRDTGLVSKIVLYVESLSLYNLNMSTTKFIDLHLLK